LVPDLVAAALPFALAFCFARLALRADCQLSQHVGAGKQTSSQFLIFAFEIVFIFAFLLLFSIVPVIHTVVDIPASVIIDNEVILIQP